VTPKIIIRQTKTAGWRVVYTASSGNEYILDRRLSEKAAEECAAAAKTVYQVPIEVEA